MKKKLIKSLKSLLSNTRFRKLVFPYWPYMFTPQELFYLCECLKKTSLLKGKIIEIGCAEGHTTIFLNRYLEHENIIKDYLVFDTFEGFTKEHINYEISFRGKREGLITGFDTNKKEWFDATMKYVNINNVTSIRGDISLYDIESFGEISFCLLDVDLYIPIKKALPLLYNQLTPGGILLVDDCTPNSVHWDGANQAYNEFVIENKLDHQIFGRKLGFIQKPL
jgi:O-methyltransferase